MNKFLCPNPTCGKLTSIEFSAGEQLAGGKDIICPYCNGHSWLSAKIGEPIFFPSATDQYDQPRELRS